MTPGIPQNNQTGTQFQKLSGAILHGSQAVGLADEASDVDLLSSKSVQELLQALRSRTLLHFELVAGLHLLSGS